MNKEELQKKNASLIGVSSSEKELAFDILIEKILERVKTEGDAIRINELGVFQLKEKDGSTELIFSPTHSSADTSSKTFFLRLPVSKSFEEDDEDIFSLSVGKPIVPINYKEGSHGEDETSFIYIKKRIEERVDEILAEAEFLSNFNLWDEYLKSTEKKEEKPDDSQFLDSLSEPEVEDDDEEEPLKQTFISDLPAFEEVPDDEEDKDKLFDDLETFKTIDEHESRTTDDEGEFLKEFESPYVNHGNEEEVDRVSEIADVDSPDESQEDDKEQLDEKVIVEKIVESDDPKQGEQKIDKGEDDKFDIDETVFQESFEDDKVDWSWGDELNDAADEEFSVSEDTENKSAEEETPKSKRGKEYDPDPFGTLERTMERDPEFKKLTREQFEVPEEEESVDKEWRVTNLDRPRSVPPKPTRMSRMTYEEPVEEIIDEPEVKTSSYRSFRDKNERANIFVISGIVVILAAIIYFAFSMGDDGQKEVISPKQSEAVISNDQPEVRDDQPVASNQPDESVEQNTQTPATRNSNSDVEEVRVSNLIFRRGNKYNVQVSSWRSSIKAENEVKRLRSRGHDAFSVQAYLPSKGGTWHRVRIGGFNSLEEARKFLNTAQL